MISNKSYMEKQVNIDVLKMKRSRDETEFGTIIEIQIP